jgi:hypothetical protein
MEAQLLSTTKPEIKRKSKTPFIGKQVIQRKLSIGSPNDVYEQEADAMADRVVSMGDYQNAVQHSGSLVQRKCAACEEESNLQMKPLSENISPLIQKKISNSEAGIASSSLAQQINSTKGSGQVMDKSTKHFMESRFGADFSEVKIHTDSQAVQMSKDLNAQAFTVGSNIYFNEGKYDPT